MSFMESNENRRRLLKSITVSGTAIIATKSLPESWIRPMVKSVIIPAHAQTSVTTLNYFGQNVSVADISDPETGLVEWTSRNLVSAAHAQATPGSNPILEMSATVTGSMATILFTPSSSPRRSWALFQSVLPTDGTSGTVDLGPGGQCPGGDPWPFPGMPAGPQGVRILDYTFGDFTITIEIAGALATRSYMLRRGKGKAGAVECLPPV